MQGFGGSIALKLLTVLLPHFLAQLWVRVGFFGFISVLLPPDTFFLTVTKKYRSF